LMRRFRGRHWPRVTTLFSLRKNEGRTTSRTCKTAPILRLFCPKNREKRTVLGNNYLLHSRGTTKCGLYSLENEPR
jgi:hypothetical protein